MMKAEIVHTLYERVGGFSKREAAAVVDATFEIMKETLGRGEHVKISGFGKLALRDKHERPGRNPQTGKALTIEARRVLAFKTSPRLKEALNAHAEVPEDDEAADVVDQRVGGRTRRR